VRAGGGSQPRVKKTAAVSRRRKIGRADRGLRLSVEKLAAARHTAGHPHATA
jgi:hypothetical protein